MVGSLHYPSTHAGGAANHAIQPCVADHLDDCRYAASRLAHHTCPRTMKFDLAGGVGMVAELVLQALDVKSVAWAIGQGARHQETREALVGLCEYEEQIGHRRRAEPLVPDDLVLRARPAAIQRPAGARVGVYARAPLLPAH